MKIDYTILDPTSGGGDTIVDTESQDFLAKVAYLVKYTGADSYRLLFGTSIVPVARDGNPVPGEYSRYTNGEVVLREALRECAVNAYLLHRSPEVAVTSACTDLGLPHPNPLPPFADEQPASNNPVGGQWLAHGAQVYHVSPVYDANPSQWPMGSLYKGRLGGLSVTWQRTTVMGSGFGGGIGPVVGRSWDPAWVLVG